VIAVKKRNHRGCQRINWSEEENDRLFSAWTKHSTDPVIGNDRKFEYYWKAVAAEFNNNAPKNSHKRSIKQLKTHWGDVKRGISQSSVDVMLELW
jgi:NADPH-dependent glutamate synthase beta subunit-like oxidoreductase